MPVEERLAEACEEHDRGKGISIWATPTGSRTLSGERVCGSIVKVPYIFQHETPRPRMMCKSPTYV
jgi:hypothetical protein